MGLFLEDDDSAQAPIGPVSEAGAPTLSEIEKQSAQVTQQHYGTAATLAGSIGLGALDLVDTVISSVPGVSRATGFQRGDLNQAALNALDMPGLTNFYNSNRGAIEATSGVAGIVGAELLTRRIAGPGSRFMEAASKLPYLRRVAALDAEYATAMQTVRAVDRNLAARGALGVEQYIGRSSVNVYDDTGLLLGKVNDAARNAVGFRAKSLAAGVAVRDAALTEATMGVTLNQNGFLYDDSASTNLALMGLGLGIAGGVGWLGGAYAIRKFANSDEIRRTFAGALDPQGVEESRLVWGKKAKDAAVNGTEPGMFLGGRFSDRVTSLLVNASQLKETRVTLDSEGRALLNSRSSLATQQLQQAYEEMQKITTQGISSQGRTRFSMSAPGYGNHLEMMMYRDAGSAAGLEQIGGLADDMTFLGVHESHMNRLEERLQSAEKQIEELQAKASPTGELDDKSLGEISAQQWLIKRIKFEKNLMPMGVIDGEFMSLAEARAFEGFIPPKEIKFTSAETLKDRFKNAFTKTDKHGLWEAITENPKGGVSLDSDFIWHIPGSKSLDKADLYDVMRLYRLGDRAAETMSKFEGALNLPKKPDWFQLDLAEEILRRNPEAKINWPAGLNRETARVESLIQKSKGLALHEKQQIALAEKMGEDYETVASRMRVRYNVPRLSSYERSVTNQVDHPVMQVLRGIDQLGEDQIRQMSLQEIQEAAAQFKRLGDIAPVTANDMDLFGNSFRFGVDEKGRQLKPLLAYKRAMDVNEWTQDHLAERLAAQKMFAISTLSSADSGPMSRNVVNRIISSPDYELASRVHELMDTQIQGSFVGGAPQSFSGALGNAVSTSEWRDRDSPIMLAASRIRETINNTVRDQMKVTFETAFGDVLGVLENPRNSGSLALLDQFHSFSSGWDLAKNPVSRENGLSAFVLSDTAENRERFKLAFGREMAKGQTLLNPAGKEVVLDSLGLDAQRRFNAVTTTLINEKNALLRAQGRGQIQERHWYVPAPGTEGKYIGFSFGPDGKTIPGLTVVESTPEAFARSRKLTEQKLDQMGLGYLFRTQEEVRSFASIFDKAQMDFIDPGTTAIQPNKNARGALTGTEIRVNAWRQSLQNTRDQFLNHGGDITEVLFKDVINSSKARAAVSAEVVANKGRLSQNRSIHDHYLENLLGTSKLTSQKSAIGRTYNAIEGFIDSGLAAAAPTATKVWSHATNWISRVKIWDQSEKGQKEFDQLSQQLGKYMPFESATQMLERQAAGATPLTVKKITGEVNRFSAAVMLRMFEVAHPIMNLAGIVNAMPSVIRNVTPRKGESAADFAARIGHSANIFDLGDGRQIGIIDMNKIGAKAFKRAWSKESHPDFEYMVRQGYLTQEVAEFHRQFSAVESPGAWEAFFYGDKNRTGFKRKGVVGWTDVLSSRSEDFSRSWGHMIGLELADNLGVKGLAARNAFAHDIANKMIANYSPHNRPEIFQGALGAPIGLFQSFMQNYYQRLFRYTETKDWQALGQQYAMQAGLFGITGIPGWQAFQSFWKGQTAGETDPNSSVYQRFGGAADMLHGGVISNIPKLFGLPGVDLYSRGDTSVRQLGIQTQNNPLTNPLKWAGEVAEGSVPAMGVLSKFWQGIGAGIGAFSAENPGLTPAQLTEIASNMVANRPLAGMIEQFLNGGNDTDQYGQLVNDTRGLAEATYRLLGLRSIRQSRSVEQFYSEKGRQEYQNAAKSQLRTATRAAMRSGNFEQNLPGIFNQYLETGGDPRYFRRWIKDNFEAATTTRSERMLKDALNGENMDQALRLMDAQVGISQDAEGPSDLGYGSNPEDELNQDSDGLAQYSNQFTLEGEQ